MSSPQSRLSIVEVLAGEDLAHARLLLEEYFAALEVDLGEARQREVASLPGEYTPPAGRLWLARSDSEAAGCAALRRLEPGIGELKRLYVRPRFRGAALGRRLAVTAIAAARQLGYERLRLDTLASMVAAQALYRDLGFREIPPYHPLPLPNAIFLELALAGAGGS